MGRRRFANPKNRNLEHRASTHVRRMVGGGKRARGTGGEQRNAYVPPEDWYEPSESPVRGYTVVHQSPGGGYQHVVTESEIRERLAALPARFLEPLEVVQLSCMTRKKKSFPCYGMQWGNTIYLYPLETELVEYYGGPPRPAEYNESRMFGGRWESLPGNAWRLVWTPQTIRDFYLNNVLIHELGHLLDRRNRSYKDRERYAEWFAIEYGYRPWQRRRKG